jgi:hypothetical protein
VYDIALYGKLVATSVSAVNCHSGHPAAKKRFLWQMSNEVLILLFVLHDSIFVSLASSANNALYFLIHAEIQQKGMENKQAIDM